MQANEEFRTIDNYPDYQISNFGRVKSFRVSKMGRILSPHDRAGKGYLSIGIFDNDGKQQWFLISVLVATFFIPNPDNLPTVDHIDLDPSNNSISKSFFVE